MQRLLTLLPALLLAACSDVPTAELGGEGGIRIMGGPPRDAYDASTQAYSSLASQHRHVRENIDPRHQNMLGARSAMERIIASLETMKSLVTPEFKGRVDRYLPRYRQWQQDVERNTWGGSFLQDFDQAEREIRARLGPNSVDLAAEAAPAAPPKPKAAEEPPQAPAAPAEPPVKKAGETPAPAPPKEDVSFRLLYLAWDRGHPELLDTYQGKKDCAARYKDVTDALALMKARLSGKPADTLQVYIDYYAAIHEKTKGFAVLPEKTGEKDILDELEVAARVIRKEFNPEK